MMKKWMVFLMALCCLSFSAAGQTRQCIPVRTADQVPFDNGEKLRFSVSYNWLGVRTDVASAIMSTDRFSFNGEPTWRIAFFVKTAKFFDVFFPVREHFESYVRISDFRPQQFLRDTKEGSYTAYNLFQYDWQARTVGGDINKSSSGRQQVQFPLGDCTADLPALVYSIRNMDRDALKIGVPYTVSFVMDTKNNDITLICKGVEQRKVAGLGKINCLKFSISVNAGEVFEGNEDAFIWFSDDEHRIPVYFTAPLKVGGVSGRLVASEGLKP